MMIRVKRNKITRTERNVYNNEAIKLKESNKRKKVADNIRPPNAYFSFRNIRLRKDGS